MTEKVVEVKVEALPYMKVDLGGRLGGEKTFFSFEELSNFIGNEQDNFAWLSNAKVDDINIGGIRSAQEHHLRKIAKLMDQLISGELLDAQKEVNKNQLRSMIGERYRQVGALHSSEPEAAFLKEELANEDPTLAGYCLGHFMGIAFAQPQQSSMISRAATRCELYRLGIRGTVESERKALQSLRTTFEKDLLEVNRRRDLQQVTFSSLTEGIEKMRESEQVKFQELEKNISDEFGQIKKAYNQEMTVQASVKYWRNKAWAHFGWFIFFFISFIGIGAGFIYGIYIVLTQYFGVVDRINNQLKMSTAEISQLSSLNLANWEMGILLFLTLLGVWLLRIVVRLMLSHVHLGSDARERVVMVKTFLSLLRKDKALTDDDRRLILSALFRPSTSGVIKDDAAPFTWMELLTRPTKS